MNEARDRECLVPFGEYLKKIRTEMDLSQDQVTLKCDLTKANLSNIENGKKDFTYTTLLEIAKGVTVSPKNLLDF